MVKFNDVYNAIAEAAKEDNPEGIQSGRFGSAKATAMKLLRDHVMHCIDKAFEERAPEIAELTKIIKGESNEY